MDIFQETTFDDEPNCINEALKNNWTIFSVDFIDSNNTTASLAIEESKYNECIRVNPHSEVKTCRHINKTDTSYYSTTCIMYRTLGNEIDILKSAIDRLCKDDGYDYIKEQLYSLLNLKQLRHNYMDSEIKALKKAIQLLQDKNYNENTIKIINNIISDIEFGR